MKETLFNSNMIYEEDDDDCDDGVTEDDDDDYASPTKTTSTTFDERDEVKKLTKKENKGVWIWKFLVVVTILGTAMMVSAGSYYLLRQGETQSFETSVSERYYERASERASERQRAKYILRVYALASL